MPVGATVRVLWLSKETPDQRGQGGQRRQFFQIRELTKAGVSVTVLVPRGDQDVSSVRALAETVFLPSGVGKFVNRHQPRRLVSSGRFDGVVIAHGESFELLQRDAATTPVPSLLDFHNVNSRWYSVLGDLERTEYWSREERKITASMSEVLACSRRDLDALPPGRAHRSLAPNGLDLDEWPLSPSVQRIPHRLAAFGSWWYPSNRKGMSWFVARVWPLICRQLPDATLQLAGSGEPPADVLSAPGVEHVGYVADVAMFLRAAHAIVMPVMDSPGTPVKFAEALASGTPMVATAEAAQGFPDAPCCATNDPDLFAQRCVQLLQDAALVERVAADARAYAEAFCQWTQTQQPLLAWATGLAGRS